MYAPIISVWIPSENQQDVQPSHATTHWIRIENKHDVAVPVLSELNSRGENMRIGTFLNTRNTLATYYMRLMSQNDASAEFPDAFFGQSTSTLAQSASARNSSNAIRVSDAVESRCVPHARILSQNRAVRNVRQLQLLVQNNASANTNVFIGID